MKNFDDAFAVLMGNEGGYVDNPFDPGGETKYGITKRVALANGYTGSMRDIPWEEAKRIAKLQYWDKFRCDEFDIRIAFQLFDCAYNGGRPVHWLQQALGITVDGVIGTETISAAHAADVDRIIMKFDAYRLKYFIGLNTWVNFSRGWVDRIANNLIQAAEG